MRTKKIGVGYKILHKNLLRILCNLGYCPVPGVDFFLIGTILDCTKNFLGLVSLVASVFFGSSSGCSVTPEL